MAVLCDNALSEPILWKRWATTQDLQQVSVYIDSTLDCQEKCVSDSSADCADKEQRLRRPAIDRHALTTKLGTSLIHTSPKTISAKPVRVSLCKPILKD